MREKDYKELFFTDDFLFCKIMTHDKSICKRVIEALLGIEVADFTYIYRQEIRLPSITGFRASVANATLPSFAKGKTRGNHCKVEYCLSALLVLDIF